LLLEFLGEDTDFSRYNNIKKKIKKKLNKSCGVKLHASIAL
jgi:hypothetical protein